MRIYFYTPEFASGGAKMMYRHAEILSDHGVPAFVLHAKKGFSNSGFSHSAQIRYWDDITLTPTDIVAIPEYVAIWMNSEINPTGIQSFFKKKFSGNRYRYHVYEAIHSPAKKVIYNQNPFYTFLNYPTQPHGYKFPYHMPDCLGAVCVSQNNSEYLQAGFPDLLLERIYYSIDFTKFNPAEKKKQIAYLTFKNQKDVAQVINLLMLRNNLFGYELVPVAGTEDEVAKQFNDSAVMLNFGNIEGFGLPPAEAMLSGCVVIGYHGEAGKEFMLPAHCFPIDNGDILSFVKTIEIVVSRLHENKHAYAAMTQAARNFIQKEYSREREIKSILSAWNKFIDLAKVRL
ncbi:MAG TPA: hypothetical protein PLM56_08095 [Cyclobacteriaceae bacterium]|jgi:hypothetical protein|nr:hypothetical protein [Cytophagales bacterium]HMR55756.1 hypothetical protein [Cyclobacteriaceae bacterium]HRE67422.1 hypothetical protein [Cyclobacteriaceae bacterium]HRF33445.1 hypothetical protein [Cyclobacteriaceae bacterium]